MNEAQSSNAVIVIDDNESEEPKHTDQSINIPVPKSARRTTTPLKSCFRAIVRGKKVAFDLKTLEQIILADLKIDVPKFDPTLMQILPYMLVSYIKSWPGWSKSEDYRNGTLQFNDWFEKFHQYATFKLKYLIQKGFQKAVNELRVEDPPKQINPDLQKSVETQTDDSIPCKSFSAFSINIEGPPRLLNTLIFASHKDDIHLKMHTIKAWSADFNIQQLMNWPFLEIEFTSPFLSFNRKINPNYMRYLAKTNDSMNCHKQCFIQEVKVNPNAKRTGPYAVDFLKRNLKGYIQFLKMKGLETAVLIEIGTVLTEFFRDIEEVGEACKHQIYDSTMISFNIGGCRYVRNKKTAAVCTPNEPDAPPVGYCEVITPRCSINLKDIYTDPSCSGNQSEDVTSSFLRLVQKAAQSQTSVDSIPSIMYSCNYCKKQYGGSFALNAVLKHYQDEHRMEHAIMCFDCKKQYNVTDLSLTRWYHSCESNRSAKNPARVSLFPGDWVAK